MLTLWCLCMERCLFWVQPVCAAIDYVTQNDSANEHNGLRPSSWHCEPSITRQQRLSLPQNQWRHSSLESQLSLFTLHIRGRLAYAGCIAIHYHMYFYCLVVPKGTTPNWQESHLHPLTATIFTCAVLLITSIYSSVMGNWQSSAYVTWWHTASTGSHTTTSPSRLKSTRLLLMPWTVMLKWYLDAWPSCHCQFMDPHSGMQGVPGWLDYF